METLEVETPDGWVPILAPVRSIGSAKYRAELRLPTVTALATAKLRYGGKPARHVVVVETKASSWPRVAIAVVEFELERDHEGPP